MSKDSEALKFNLKFESPDDPAPKSYLQCGLVYNPQLVIDSVKSPTFSHRGIDYEFCTEICNYEGNVIKYNVTNKHLSDSGVINHSICFDLPQIKTMQNAQTYHGALFAVRHYVRVWVKKFFGMETLEREIYIYKAIPYPKRVEPYNWTMIIDETFRINILMQRRKFDLDDVIMGELNFIITNIKIEKVRVQIVAQETLEVNGISKKFKNIIDYWEISVGTPVKGELIPFRLFLKPVKIYPSTSNVELGYSSTHFVHFTVITETGSKYFKALQIRVMKMDRLPFFFDGEDDEELAKFQKQFIPNSKATQEQDKTSRKLFLDEGNKQHGQDQDEEEEEEKDEDDDFEM